MTEQGIVTVGMTVPNSEMETYDPAAREFGTISLAQVKYPMGADPTGTVSKLFGVYDGSTGLALRGTFIINPAGVLVSSEVHFYNVGRNAEELLRKMEANSYLMAHPDEACPAKWHQGGKTLKPGKDLVGKVYEALRA